MNSDQIILFVLLFYVFVFLIWGRWRYDPVAFSALTMAASCAFLTPSGHKNNTLIMGPGGYCFGNFWRLGPPMESLIILVSTPIILWVLPL